MGSPPRYSVPDEEQALPSHPLLASPQPEYAYPPTHRPTFEDDDAPSVVYFYHSPHSSRGQSERLMGKLFLSKEDTIIMVQSAITPLADVERSRIHFHSLVNPDAPAAEQTWARVLDEVWVKMVQNKPHTLKITYEEPQEDIDKRNTREAYVVCAVFGVIIVIFLIIGVILFHK